MYGLRFFLLFIALVCTMPSLVHADSGFEALSDYLSQPKKSSHSRFLPVEQAFNVSGVRSDRQYTVNFSVTPGHYLYLDKISFQPTAGLHVLGTPQYDHSPVTEDDPDFGQVKVFDTDVQAILPVKGSGKLTVKWQGCAKAGLCYPPQTTVLNAAPEKVEGYADPSANSTHFTSNEVQQGAASSSLVDTARFLGIDPQTQVDPERMVLRWTVPNYFDASLGVLGPEQLLSPSSVAAASHFQLAKQCQVNLTKQQDSFGLTSSPLLALGGIFFMGLLLSLTPCMLPMLPLVANMVARQHRRSAWHGLLLALAYVIGIASSYAILGGLVAVFGQQIHLVNWLQSPFVLLLFAALFLILGFVSLGIVKLPLPNHFRQKLHALSDHGAQYMGASYLGSFIAGLLSAFVVSPCVSAPLAALLLSVSTSGSAVIGSIALFVFALGLGIPLLVLGATEGKLLPAPGPWMEWINKGFGLMLLGLGLNLLERVFPSAWVLAAWGVLALLAAYWLWQATFGKGQWFTRFLAGVSVLIAGAWFTGAALGNADPLHPFSSHLNRLNIPKLTSTTALKPVIEGNPRVIVDVTADWCVACAKMDRTLFANPPSALQKWKVVKLDVTKNSPQVNQILKEFGLFGPPALIYFVDGKIVAKSEGEVSRPEFESYLNICD